MHRSGLILSRVSLEPTMPLRPHTAVLGEIGSQVVWRDPPREEYRIRTLHFAVTESEFSWNITRF